jgi:hypothetical protein
MFVQPYTKDNYLPVIFIFNPWRYPIRSLSAAIALLELWQTKIDALERVVNIYVIALFTLINWSQC